MTTTKQAVEQEKQRCIRVIKSADSKVLPSYIKSLLKKLIQHIEEGRCA